MFLHDAVQCANGVFTPTSIAPLTKQIHDAIHVLMKTAQVFHLTKEFAVETARLFPNPNDLAKAMPLFKLPYPVVWYEFPVTTPNHQYGVLLHETIEDGEKWVGVYFYGKRFNNLKLLSVGGFIPSSVICEDNVLSYNLKVCQSGDDEDDADEKHQFNGVATSIMAMTLYLNSPAISHISDVVDMSRLNKKRSHQGKPSLMAYRTVTISKEIKQARMLESAYDKTGKRIHWCRRHYKQLHDGLHWWNPHLRGRKELGEVRKDYVA
jgi:hypothetical protein